MGRAIYQDIYHDLREAIVSGDIKPSAFLPSEAELVARYSCSRMTIRKAVSLLANEGVVQPIRGRGVRVISHPSDAINKEDAFRVNGLSSFTESARVIGAKPASKLFLLDSVTALLANEMFASPATKRRRDGRASAREKSSRASGWCAAWTGTSWR